MSVSRDRCDLPRENAHQRGFTRAVAAENADPVARIHRERHILDDAARTVAGGQLLQGEQRPRQFGGSRELPFEARLRLYRGDFTEARQRLDAALHLLGLGRLCTKALDKTRDSRGLAFLSGDECPRALALGRVLYFEGAVVARVGAQPAGFDEQDAAHHAVQEFPVVGYQQQCAGIVPQPLLEPEDRVEIEVVGRLVEQQQVRAAHQRARQVRPHFQAARELSHGAVDFLGREPESRRQLRGAAPAGISGEPLIFGVQRTDAYAVGILLGLRELRLHGAQLEITIENVLGQRRVRVGQLLCDGRHREIRRRGVFAGIR